MFQDYNLIASPNAGQLGKFEAESEGQKSCLGSRMFAQGMAPRSKSHQGVQARHYRRGREPRVC